MLKKIGYAAEYLMLCAVILIFWIITDMNGKLNPVVMPSPERVWDTLIILVQKGTLGENILISLSRVLK